MTVSRDVQGEHLRQTQARSTPLPLGIKFLYAFGAVPDLAVNTAINVFLLFYATAVCGIPASLAGGALGLGLVIDAVVDPLIGSISDNHHSRLGRRLPFMLGAIPVVAGSFIMLFSLPQGWGPLALFAALALSSMVVRISLSCLILPSMAIAAEISDDDKERDQLLSWRWLAGMVTALMVVGLGLGVFFKGPDGTMARAAYPAFATCLAAMSTVGGLLASFVAYRTLPRQHLPPSQGRVPFTHLVAELREVLQSGDFRILLLVIILFSSGNGMGQALSLHANTFFWKLPGDQAQVPTIALAAGLILGAPVAAWALRRAERKTCGCITLLVLALSQMLLPTLRLLGALPVEGHALLGLLCLTFAIGGAGLTVAAIAAMSMINQVVDVHELHRGGRREGVYYAGFWFAQKTAGGLGSFLAGVALDLIRFPVEQTKAQGAALVLPDSISNALGFCCGPVAAVLTAASALAMLGFRLDSRTHASVVERLKLIRGTALNAAQP